MINFGDTGLIVQYIQNFLKDNYDDNIHLSDVYDKETHEALINYLQLPEILDSITLKNNIITTYTFRSNNPPYQIYNGGGIWNFDCEITTNTIRFYSKPVTQCFENALLFMHDYLDEIDEFCRNNGWFLKFHSPYIYNKNDIRDNDNNFVEFILQQELRQQLLPCKDIINMINLSRNDYLIEKCFLDENNAYHGFINDSKYYKINYIPIKPGDVVTIAHGYQFACELAIGYTENSLSELKQESYCTVENIVSYLNKSKNGELKPGKYEIYEIPKNSKATFLLIQMPYRNNLISFKTQKKSVKLGDINGDGKVDIEDLNLLRSYVTAKKNGNKLPFILSDINLLAANLNKDVDIDGNPIIDDLDLKIFESQINNDRFDFGEVEYEKQLDLSESDYDKVLIMYGDFEKNNKNNKLNIPITEYQTNPWSIHECFLPYILGSTIHKYSHVQDIDWLQKLIVKLEPKYVIQNWGLYDDENNYLTNDKFIWDSVKNVYKYFQNNSYSGLILDSGDLYNGYLRNENDLTLINIKIVNGKLMVNNVWTGNVVLNNGYIVNESYIYSLKNIIKNLQITSNEYYKNQTDKQIKFINGYVDPLTEKRIKFISNDF